MDVTKPYKFIGFGAEGGALHLFGRVWKPTGPVGTSNVNDFRLRPLGQSPVAMMYALPMHMLMASGNKSRTATLCYAIVLPECKSAFRFGFWPGCYRENTEIGPPAGLRPA